MEKNKNIQEKNDHVIFIDRLIDHHIKDNFQQKKGKNKKIKINKKNK